MYVRTDGRTSRHTELLAAANNKSLVSPVLPADHTVNMGIPAYSPVLPRRPVIAALLVRTILKECSHLSIQGLEFLFFSATPRLSSKKALGEISDRLILISLKDTWPWDSPLHFICLCEGHLGHIVGVGADLEFAGLRTKYKNNSLHI